MFRWIIHQALIDLLGSQCNPRVCTVAACVMLPLLRLVFPLATKTNLVCRDERLSASNYLHQIIWLQVKSFMLSQRSCRPISLPGPD